MTNNAYVPVIPPGYDCGAFTYGLGSGIYGGMKFGVNIYEDWAFVELRPWFEQRGVLLEYQSDCLPTYDDLAGEYTNVVRNHSWESQLEYLLLNSSIKIMPMNILHGLDLVPDWSKIPFFFRAGYESGTPSATSEFTNTDEIVLPVGALFSDSTSTRIIDSGDLTAAGISNALNLAVGFDFEIPGGLVVSPEVMYRRELNSQMNSYKWKAEIWRVGLAFSWNYHFQQKYELAPPVPEPALRTPILAPAPLMPPVPPLVRDFVSNIETGRIDLLQTIVTQTYPILPYIFFDHGKSELRDIYFRDKNNYSEESLPKNTVDIYYRLLDILGSRLAEYPQARLNLTGATDGKEMSQKADLFALARNRASSIANYLEKTWGINKMRLKINFREFPLLATSGVYREGFEENRRVEIACDDPRVLAPVQHSEFFEYTANKSALSFDLELEEIGEKSIEISLIYDGNTIGHEIFAKLHDGRQTIGMRRDLLNRLGHSFGAGKELIAVCKVIDGSDTIQEIEKRISLTKTESEYEVGRLNLIVFDFDKADISESNQEMIQDFIKLGINPDSFTKITGSTDRLGETKYNQNLSLRRAEAVAGFIKNVIPSFSADEVVGLGSSVLEFDNALPEGRFYCRTVLIEVKTPIK
jgi:outer membrane protein OmpA-like peptidoglycan-associated protein